MSFLRRIVSRAYRQALSAEGAGDYRRAASLYVEAGMQEEAANALLFHAARATELEDRLSAFRDALRWLPDDHARRPGIEAQIGLAIVEDARRHGAHTAEQKARLAEAAGELERLDRPGDAATGWELLERWEEVARCLEAAGDVERLERLLARTSAEEERARTLGRAVREHERAIEVGARAAARAALREAVRAAPGDAAVEELLRRLESRIPPAGRVELGVDGRRTIVVGRAAIVLGRVGADVPLRGASVSRRHAELFVRGGALVVRDLDSRNGTLLRGVPIAAEVEVSGDAVIGLGDDVELSVSVSASSGTIAVEVRRGLDAGLVALAGEGDLALPQAPGVIAFPEGWATLRATSGTALALAGRACALPVELLVGDALTLGSHRVEVLG